ncbi:MAG: type II toxin-antitoxin system death-on-curing family toxin [Anaerolineae bacterium]
MEYLTLHEVLLLHARLIQRTGGAPGLRDLGLLESELARMRATFEGADLYPGLWLKGAVLLHALCQNHPFVDGNKRVAFAAVGLFVEINGYALRATHDQAQTLMRAVATAQIDVEGIAAWLSQQTGPLDPAR